MAAMAGGRWLGERGARVLTGVHALALVVTLALVITGRLRGAQRSWWEQFFGAINVPVTRSLFSLVILALLTRALLSRKRIALWLVGTLQVLGAYYSFVALVLGSTRLAPWRRSYPVGRPADIVAVIVAPLVLVWLWRLRSAFPARLVPGSLKAAITTLVAGLLLSTGLATLAIWSQVGSADLGRRTYAAVHEAAGDIDYFTEHGLTGVSPWIVHSLSLLYSLSLIAAVIVFLRSVRPDNSWAPDRELTIRRLLRRYGEADSLGYFATRRDKSSIFSADGSAAVTYRVIAGVSLASADPIGRPASWPAAIAAWMTEARAYGWVPAVLGASADGAKAYAGAGLHAIALGDEAVLDPDRFDLRSSAMTPVRHAAERCRRAGVVVTARRQRELSADELAETSAKAVDWIGDEPERGFSMALNRAVDEADGATLIVTARDQAGALVGLLTLVPWGRSGVSLDVMRRSPEAPNGITEAMVAHVMEHAAELGVRRLSLNFCMFRTVYADNEALGVRPVNRLNYSVLGFLDRFWQFERLYRSNQKYDPEWVPRFACYDGAVAIVPVAIAAANAEGFLNWRPRFLGTGLPETRLEPAVLAEALAIEDEVEAAPSVRRGDQTLARVAKLDLLRAAGRDPYPVGPGLAQGAAAPQWRGRVRAVRDHGGVVFADIEVDGRRTQLLLDASVCAARDFARLVDTGDLISVLGAAGRSRNGSAAVHVQDWTMLAKSLHAIPFGGFTDPQARVRQRSLDMIVNPEATRALRDRTAVVRALRARLDATGFTEVETPILQAVHGGASARPFRTHINAYHADLSLRIAPELYLKRLVVGGFGRVYELGRNFRNEGADATHNPEFTSLEAYQPMADYTDMRVLTQALVCDAARAVHRGLTVPNATHGPLDLAGDWAVVSVLDAVSTALGEQVSLDTDTDALLAHAKRLGIVIRPGMGPGGIIEALYGELVEPMTIAPTFYVDFPAETSPLTRPHRSIHGLVERWDLVVAGMELATAYSELTDPVEQRRRLTAQSLRAAHGDPEAMEVDEAFLGALELGMPPCGGMGMGVDRLAMLLSGTSIRGVLTFPFVKP